MTIQKVTMVQSGINVDTTIQIPTGLTVDGRTGWNVLAVRALAMVGTSVTPIADSTIALQLNTEAGSQVFTDNDNIAYIPWLFSGMAGSTSAFQVEPRQQWVSVVGRLTVQPDLFLFLTTTGLTGVAVIYLEIDYEIVKLTDMEVMRLLQGGA